MSCIFQTQLWKWKEYIMNIALYITLNNTIYIFYILPCANFLINDTFFLLIKSISRTQKKATGPNLLMMCFLWVPYINTWIYIVYISRGAGGGGDCRFCRVAVLQEYNGKWTLFSAPLLIFSYRFAKWFWRQVPLRSSDLKVTCSFVTRFGQST